jgi:type IV pilus assembly protein PilP
VANEQDRSNFMNRLTAVVRTLCGFSCLLLLSACSGNEDMIALQNYVNTVVNRPPGAIEPPPQFLSYEPFTYSAASLRGPFDVPVDVSNAVRNQQINEVRPDESRPREYLESFALGNLVMVGTLSRQGESWALIRDETGNVNRVTIGNYMGRNHGRVVAIADLQIDVLEIVPTGDGGWIERPQTIVLQE